MVSENRVVVDNDEPVKPVGDIDAAKIRDTIKAVVKIGKVLSSLTESGVDDRVVAALEQVADAEWFTGLLETVLRLLGEGKPEAAVAAIQAAR